MTAANVLIFREQGGYIPISLSFERVEGSEDIEVIEDIASRLFWYVGASGMGVIGKNDPLRYLR